MTRMNVFSKKICRALLWRNHLGLVCCVAVDTMRSWNVNLKHANQNSCWKRCSNFTEENSWHILVLEQIEFLADCFQILLGWKRFFKNAIQTGISALNFKKIKLQKPDNLYSTSNWNFFTLILTISKKMVVDLIA